MVKYGKVVKPGKVVKIVKWSNLVKWSNWRSGQTGKVVKLEKWSNMVKWSNMAEWSGKQAQTESDGPGIRSQIRRKIRR